MQQVKIRNISDYNVAFSALGVTLYRKKNSEKTNTASVVIHRKGIPAAPAYNATRQLEVF